MSLSDPIPLGDVHSELSCIIYAVQEGLKDFGVTVELRYNPYTYLDVLIEAWPSTTVERTKLRMEGIVARLQHGILWGEYDYRFRTISHPMLEHLKDYESFYIRASVDLHHWPHRKPHGWEPIPTTLEWHERLSQRPSYLPNGAGRAVV